MDRRRGRRQTIRRRPDRPRQVRRLRRGWHVGRFHQPDDPRRTSRIPRSDSREVRRATSGRRHHQEWRLQHEGRCRSTDVGRLADAQPRDRACVQTLPDGERARPATRRHDRPLPRSRHHGRRTRRQSTTRRAPRERWRRPDNRPGIRGRRTYR